MFTGFFVEGSGQSDDLTPVLEALAVAEAKLDGINVTGLNFITEDWTPRWQSLSTAIDQVNSNSSQVQGGVQAIESKLDSLQIDGGIQAIESKLDSLQINVGNLPQEIQNLLGDDGGLNVELLLYLLGFSFFDPPEGAPPISDIPMFSELYRSLGSIESATVALETKTDSLEAKFDSIEVDLVDLIGVNKVDIEVVEYLRSTDDDEDNSSYSSYSGKSLVVALTETGLSVDAEVTHVFAVSDNAGVPFAVEVVWNTTAIQTGLVLLDVELPWAVRSATIFLIQVAHAHGAGNPHEGSKLVDLGTTREGDG